MTGDPRDLPLPTHSFPTRLSSDLAGRHRDEAVGAQRRQYDFEIFGARQRPIGDDRYLALDALVDDERPPGDACRILDEGAYIGVAHVERLLRVRRSEEHTSELQSLMRISYAVFRLKKNTHT